MSGLKIVGRHTAPDDFSCTSKATVYVNNKMVADRVRITSEKHLHDLVVKYGKAAKRAVHG